MIPLGVGPGQKFTTDIPADAVAVPASSPPPSQEAAAASSNKAGSNEKINAKNPYAKETYYKKEVGAPPSVSISKGSKQNPVRGTVAPGAGSKQNPVRAKQAVTKREGGPKPQIYDAKGNLVS
jgi:hypothetical protein